MPNFSQFCAEFSEKVFSDIRGLSAGREGILRMGYSKTETKVGPDPRNTGQPL